MNQANKSFTNHLSRRAFLKASAGAAATAALAACVPAAAPAGEGGASEPAPARNLTVWAHRSFAPPADEILLNNIQTWATENGVDLELVAEIEVPTMNDRLVAAIESGNLPDMSAIAGGRIALHYPANIYADVSDLYADLAEEYGGFFRPAEQMATIDGSQWVIPYSIDTSLMHYRQDILDENGLSVPTTWDEFVNAMETAQNPPDLYGAGIGLNLAAGDAENTFKLMLLGFGGAWSNEAGNEIVINSEATHEWLNYVITNIWERGILPPNAFEYDNATNNADYQNGSVIAVHNPASVLVWLLENNPEMAANTAIAGVPAGPEGAFNSAGIRVCWSIFNSASEENQQLSGDLLRYLWEPAQYEPWIALAFASPALAQYEEMEMWDDPQRAGFLEAAKTGVLSAHPSPITPASSELLSRNPTLAMVLRVIIDEWTMEEAIAEAETVAMDIYSKYDL
ncbi:MAG: extracellular solute-binding protein [Litorilinea sp.]